MRCPQIAAKGKKSSAKPTPHSLQDNSYAILKLDGIIVYSTCSTAPEENEEVISWALNEYPIKLVSTGFDDFQEGFISAFDKEYHPDLLKARRLYPHLNGTEGFFFCKLKLEEEIP